MELLLKLPVVVATQLRMIQIHGKIISKGYELFYDEGGGPAHTRYTEKKRVIIVTDH